MKKILNNLLLFTVFLLCGCSYPKEFCDSCNKNEQCECCELKIKERITKDNLTSFLKITPVHAEDVETYNVYSIKISGVLSSAFYEGNIKFNIINSYDYLLAEPITLKLDKSGSSESDKYKFIYSGSAEDFPFFVLNEVDAFCIY